MHPNHSLHLVQIRHHDLQGAAPTHRAPRIGRLRARWFSAVRPTRFVGRDHPARPAAAGAPAR